MRSFLLHRRWHLVVVQGDNGQFFSAAAKLVRKNGRAASRYMWKVTGNEMPLKAGGGFRFFDVRTESPLAGGEGIETLMGSETKTEIGLGILARSYGDDLTNFLRRRINNPTEASDVAQDVFLKMARMHDLSAIQNPKQYMFRVAINIVNDRLRRERVRRHTYEDIATTFTEANTALSPERLLIGREALKAVERALQTLPERTRHILILRAFEEMRSVEIAKAVGISRRAVEKHYAAALVHIRQQVSEYCEF